MTLTAMRPDSGRSKGREISLWSVSQGLLVDLGLQRRLERLVGVIRSQEIGVADEEALLVIVGIDKPAGDALGAVAADLAGVGVENVHAVYLDLELFGMDAANFNRDDVDVRLAEDDEKVSLCRCS